ncbi:MAG: EamA family transporter, partial [Prochlorococcus sp.]
MSSPWPPWIEGATEVGRGCRMLVSSCLAFSLMTVCVKQLGGRLPVSEIVFVRSLISIVLTLISLQSLGISAWGERRGLLLV